MSDRLAEAALLYEKSKTAMLFGLGYLAATNPRKAVRLGAEIFAFHFKELGGQATFYKDVGNRYFLDPAIKDLKASTPKAKLGPATVVTAGAWIPLVLFGGYTVYAIEDTNFSEKLQDLLNIEMPGEGGDPFV